MAKQFQHLQAGQSSRSCPPARSHRRRRRFVVGRHGQGRRTCPAWGCCCVGKKLHHWLLPKQTRMPVGDRLCCPRICLEEWDREVEFACISDWATMADKVQLFFGQGNFRWLGQRVQAQGTSVELALEEEALLPSQRTAILL